MTHLDALTKLYIEITTDCSLDCTMCVRRTWDEPIGSMPLSTFSHLMEQVRQLPSTPVIHLSGYGEPMIRPDFLEIVRQAKATGAQVEITTNGMLLDANTAAAYRVKLREFPFSPYTTCGGCERFPANFEDCVHNTFPTCGGCLWAQGFVQCP